MTARKPDPIRIVELRSVWGTGGGPEKTILLGAVRSNPDHFAVTVCYIRDDRDPVFGIDKRAGDLEIDYVEIRERHSFDRSIWPALRKLVRDRRIDIVHAHDYKTDLVALALGRFEAVVPLSTAHGWAGHSWKERRLYYPADRFLLTRFPRVIVVSDDMRRALVRSGAEPARVTVVPNGIDHVAFRRDPARVPAARQTLTLEPGETAIGAVGRLETEKNYPLLIRAFASIATEFPRARLFIGGDGSLRDALEALIKELGLTDRCRLLGHVRDVIEMHHALDLFVMCSDNEGSPNAVLEAMALETPVVATDVGGVADLVSPRTEGLLVPRRNLEALTNAIRTALSDRLATAGRTRVARLKVEHELSFDRRMTTVEGIYTELMTTYSAIRQGRRWRKAAHE